MNNEYHAKCHVIIHSASVSAAGIGAGLVQIPCSDNAVITPIQITMIVSLGKVFGLTLSQSAAEATLASTLCPTIGRAVSQVLFGWIPGFGNAINATTAGAITETIGWTIAEEFFQRTAENIV